MSSRDRLLMHKYTLMELTANRYIVPINNMSLGIGRVNNL